MVRDLHSAMGGVRIRCLILSLSFPTALSLRDLGSVSIDLNAEEDVVKETNASIGSNNAEEKQTSVEETKASVKETRAYVEASSASVEEAKASVEEAKASV